MESILDFYPAIESWLETAMTKNVKRPLLLGISAPQGTGKSTLANYLVTWFNKNNINALNISIDDFYLTHSDQLKLAKKYSANPYLQQRGYPGTHDMPLLYQTIGSLLKGQKINIPRYDKTKFNGLGDRLSTEQWERIETAPDIIVLEGWMLGFAPSSEGPANPSLKLIDSVLENYRELNLLFDLFIHLKAQRDDFVLTWRSQAEREAREQGKGAMSEEDIKVYLETFLPAYKRYNTLLNEKKSVDCPCYQITLDIERSPILYRELA